MKEPKLEKILELETRLTELNKEFDQRAAELRTWFTSQEFSILELELVDPQEDFWDIMGALEDSWGGDDEPDIPEEEYFQMLRNFEEVLEKRRSEGENLDSS